MIFLHNNSRLASEKRPWLVIRLVLMASLVLLVACAVVESPSGGEADTQPPYLAQAIPDSGSVGLLQFDTIYLSFSEKMNRTSAVTWLHFFPDQRIRKTKWHGSTMAEIVLEYPLPADTTIIIEIPAGMQDAHKVKSPHYRSFPISTADSLARGTISGILVLGEEPVAKGVVELFDIPPDTLEYFQQPLLRRTITDENGRFVFQWLPVPGGPWLMRSFVDKNGDLRPGDNEAQRLMPDTLSVSWEAINASAGVTTLYAANTPGRLVASALLEDTWEAPHFAFAHSITDADTGWVPAPEDSTKTTSYALLPEGGSVVADCTPGPNRVFVFADLDSNAAFNAIVDSLWPGDLLPVLSQDAVQDSVQVAIWYLEPHAVTENVAVLPGLDSPWDVPALLDTLLTWIPPPMEEVAEEESVDNEELPETSEDAEQIEEETPTPEQE